MSSPSSSSADPEVYEATCATDGSDAVDRGAKLTKAQAIARRKGGGDIVVCGPDTIKNDRVAREIETAATHPGGRCIYHGPHGGPLSLPHWQQDIPPPEGHSFHETNARQARTTS
jgi:hypothetical protein